MLDPDRELKLGGAAESAREVPRSPLERCHHPEPEAKLGGAAESARDVPRSPLEPAPPRPGVGARWRGGERGRGAWLAARASHHPDREVKLAGAALTAAGVLHPAVTHHL